MSADSKEMTHQQEFANQCLGMIYNSFGSLCIGVGYKLKLFDHLNETLQTSEEISKRAGLRERYVREWLKSMVACDIVDVNAEGDKFSLRDYKRNVLHGQTVRGTSYLHLFAAVFDQLVECFKPDGPTGIPYSAYDNFHKIMTEDSDAVHHVGLLTVFIPAVPGLVDKLKAGVICLDIGCGHGTPSYLLARKYPKSTFYGIDFIGEAIEVAKQRAADDKLTNLHYFTYDAVNLPQEWSNTIDYVTAFDAIHDQAYPDKVLTEVFRVLKPGGLFSMADINAHTNVVENKSMGLGAQFLYTASLFHCMPVSLYFEGGMGLGTAWGKEKAADMLHDAGFVGTDFSLATSSDFNYHCLSMKPNNH